MYGENTTKNLQNHEVNKGIGEDANVQLNLFPTQQLFFFFHFALFSSVGQHLNLCVPTEAYINAKSAVSLDFAAYNPKGTWEVDNDLPHLANIGQIVNAAPLPSVRDKIYDICLSKD